MPRASASSLHANSPERRPQDSYSDAAERPAATFGFVGPLLSGASKTKAGILLNEKRQRSGSRPSAAVKTGGDPLG